MSLKSRAHRRPVARPAWAVALPAVGAALVLGVLGASATLPSTYGSSATSTQADISQGRGGAAALLPAWRPSVAPGSGTSTSTPSATAAPGPVQTPETQPSVGPAAPAQGSTSPAGAPRAAAKPRPTSPPPVVVPPSSAWPGSGTTGVPAGLALSASPAVTVTTPGTVLRGLDISGTVTISAPNVVISDCLIHGDGSGNGIQIEAGSVTVEDTEITAFENAILGGSWTANRVNIHGMTGDGVKLGSDVLLENSWIHDLTPAPGAHADGGQMQDGVRNLVVRGNRIDVSTEVNSALFLAPDFGPSTNGPVTIESNYLSGGGFTLYVVDGSNGRYVVGNITVRDNVFGASKFGSIHANVPVTWSGNVSSTGLPIQP